MWGSAPWIPPITDVNQTTVAIFRNLVIIHLTCFRFGSCPSDAAVATSAAKAPADYTVCNFNWLLKVSFPALILGQ